MINYLRIAQKLMFQIDMIIIYNYFKSEFSKEFPAKNLGDLKCEMKFFMIFHIYSNKMN